MRAITELFRGGPSKQELRREATKRTIEVAGGLDFLKEEASRLRSQGDTSAIVIEKSLSEVMPYFLILRYDLQRDPKRINSLVARGVELTAYGEEPEVHLTVFSDCWDHLVMGSHLIEGIHFDAERRRVPVEELKALSLGDQIRLSVDHAYLIPAEHIWRPDDNRGQRIF